MTEKAFCYEMCKRDEHDCFGGYLIEDPQCDGEILRIKNKLKSEHPKSIVLFAPQNINGLRFKVIKSPSERETVYKLHKGEISLIKTTK